jgi:hypothetical protein
MLGGVLHAPWMDVFVAHIGLHFVPAPLAVTFAVLAAGLLSWPLLRLEVRGVAIALAAVALLTILAIPLLSPGPPATLEELCADPQPRLRPSARWRSACAGRGGRGRTWRMSVDLSTMLCSFNRCRPVAAHERP